MEAALLWTGEGVQDGLGKSFRTTHPLLGLNFGIAALIRFAASKLGSDMIGLPSVCLQHAKTMVVCLADRA